MTEFVQTPVEVYGSGRTDAGVHALGQTASVKLPGFFKKEELLTYLNHYLPEDIRVLCAETVTDSFHARLSAIRKTYAYHVDTGSKKDVFERKYVYGFPFPLDREAMEQASRYLTGTHDFKSFCGNKKMKKSTIRTLENICIREQNGRFTFVYTGNGFLQYMVRILTKKPCVRERNSCGKGSKRRRIYSASRRAFLSIRRVFYGGNDVTVWLQ